MEVVDIKMPSAEEVFRQRHPRVAEMLAMVDVDYVQALREAAKANGYIKLNGQNYAVVDIRTSEDTLVDIDLMTSDKQHMLLAGWAPEGK